MYAGSLVGLTCLTLAILDRAPDGDATSASTSAPRAPHTALLSCMNHFICDPRQYFCLQCSQPLQVISPQLNVQLWQPETLKENSLMLMNSMAMPCLLFSDF